MALYEYLNTGDDNASYCDSGRYIAQVFTVGSIGHTVTSVKLKIYRQAGYDVNTTAAIYGVDGSDLPDDTNVLTTSAAVAYTSIGTDTAGSWVEFTFAAPPSLTRATKYAVVLIPATIIGSDLYWRMDTGNGYADGELALRSGGSWGTSWRR